MLSTGSGLQEDLGPQRTASRTTTTILLVIPTIRITTQLRMSIIEAILPTYKMQAILLAIAATVATVIIIIAIISIITITIILPITKVRAQQRKPIETETIRGLRESMR